MDLHCAMSGDWSGFLVSFTFAAFSIMSTRPQKAIFMYLFIYLFTYSFVCLFVYFIYSNAIISEDIDFI